MATDSFAHLEPAFAKLIEQAKQVNPYGSIADVVDLALATLRYRENDDNAYRVLLSILFCDGLAEAIATSPNPEVPKRDALLAIREQILGVGNHDL